MCGIGGLVGSVVDGLADRINRLQAHRGPDGNGTFEDTDARVALAHVRLAILDLSDQAAQPMHSADGRYVLAYNGEIYNFAELREELEADGDTFRSSGDTEVLLTGLARHGTDFLRRLNGMFALALWDRQERSLLLARDPAGIKPLYLAEPAPGALLFASEIKALFAWPDLPREIDPVALQQHLFFLHACGTRTMLRGVRRLPPGTWLRWIDGRADGPHAYWTPQVGSGDGGSGLARELAETVAAAVTGQTVSDVPVGTFLSGGLDSSLVTALAMRDRDQRLEAWCIGYPPDQMTLDRQPDDAPFAHSLAADLGIALHAIAPAPDVVSLWPKLIWHLDEPVADPAAIASYLICEQARAAGVPVLLSGQGADELFAGYPRYRAAWALARADLVPWPLRWLASRTARLLPGAVSGRAGAMVRRVRRVATEWGEPPDRRFLAWCGNAPAVWARRALSPDIRHQLAGEGPIDEDLRAMEADGLRGVDRYLARDFSTYLPNHNLLYTDKTGMAVGIEARVPLLDQRVIDFVLPLPAHTKIAGGRTKVLLREASRGAVPDAIIDRRKAGFGAPVRKWMRHDLAGMWDELTSLTAVEARGWFDGAQLQRARELSQSGRVDLYLLQWAVLTLELWARQFIDQDPGSAVA